MKESEIYDGVKLRVYIPSYVVPSTVQKENIMISMLVFR